MKSKHRFFLTAFSIMAIFSCTKKDATSELPVITNPGASDISNVTDTTASLNVTITSEGATAITAKGVCWSTSHNPTIEDNKTSNRHGSGSSIPNKTTDITANFTFTATLTGLLPHTNYYARIYATNGSGTSYSNEILITTTGTDNTVTDIDGNVYETVTIGTQVWMKENLKTTRYNDGTAIPTNLDDSHWVADTIGAYAVFDNADSNNIRYGKLYNWYAVNTGKLAPAGWHVPDTTEWRTLTSFLGGESGAGDKMKAITLWTPFSGINNTNSSGFTALPASDRTTIGSYDMIGLNAFFWSSTKDDRNFPWYLTLSYNDSNSYMTSDRLINNDNKINGFSVRCIKD